MNDESQLLTAMRNQIRSELSIENRQCDVEFDEEVPTIVGDFYIIVMPGTITNGPKHDSSGGVIDIVISADVSVMVRITAKPVDRQREKFNAEIGSINARLQQVFDAIDFSYVTMNAANSLIGSDAFLEPPRFTGVGPVRIKGGEFFRAGGDEARAGLIRRMSFGGARSMKVRT